MKCQACDKPVTCHVTDIVEGKPVEYHVCEEHARKVEGLEATRRARGPGMEFAAFVSDPQLREAMRDQQTRNKMAAHLLPPLCLALLDERPEVRVAAAYRLMTLHSDARSALGALQDALRDPDERVRKAADLALRYIQGEEKAPWLI
jgi:hypothetical protein